MASENGHPPTRRAMFNQDAVSGSGSGQPKGSAYVKTRHQALPRQGYRPQILRPASSAPAHHTVSNGSKLEDRLAGNVRDRSVKEVSLGKGKRSQTRRKSKKRYKSSKQKIIVSVLLLLVLVVGSVYAVYAQLETRLKGTLTNAGSLPGDVGTLPEYQADMVSFLVCGIDYNNENADGYINPEDKVGRTDMILYVYYNLKENKVRILQIPRDTFVGTSAPTGQTYRINGLYFNAQDPNNRMAPLARIINEQYHLPIDFYVTIDMDAVRELVDIKGSLLVYVPEDLVDPGNTQNVLEKGWRHLDGATTEFVLRNRTSPAYLEQGDIARLRTQQSFYSALYREFKTLAPKDLLMWMKVLTYRIKTDASLWDLGGIAQKALRLNGEDITLIRAKCGPVNYGGQVISTLDGPEFADILNEYFRPTGFDIPYSDLKIETLPFSDWGGFVPTEIKTMAEVQSSEPALSP